MVRPRLILALIVALSVFDAPGSAQPCPPVQVAKLLPHDGVQFEEFGMHVSIAGDVAAVMNLDSAGQLGAYVYRFDGSRWIQEQRLAPPFGVRMYGQPIVTDGQIIAAGTLDNSVLIYRYDGSYWIHEDTLVPSFQSRTKSFGDAIAIDVNTIAVGAPFDDSDTCSQAGAGYVFRFDGTTWSEEARVVGLDCEARIAFNIDISGDVMVIGGSGNDAWQEPHLDYALVYHRTGDEWQFHSKLTTPFGRRDDSFGVEVSVSGDTIAVSAYEDDNMHGDNAGAVWVFEFDGNAWRHSIKLVADDITAHDQFGKSIHLDGNHLLIGADRAWGRGGNSGKAYLFERIDEGEWVQRKQFLPSDGRPDMEFGHRVFFNGRWAIVGAPLDDDLAANSGAAYIYDLDRIGCEPQLTIAPHPPASNRNLSFLVTNLIPRSPAFLAVSVAGDGSTYIPELDVTLDLASPMPLDAGTMTDAMGSAKWRVPLNARAQGRDVWIQACQFRRVTNVVSARIQ